MDEFRSANRENAFDKAETKKLVEDIKAFGITQICEGDTVGPDALKFVDTKAEEFGADVILPISYVFYGIAVALCLAATVLALSKKPRNYLYILLLILAGASVDDVFVIVVFTALTTLASTGTVSVSDFLQIPTAICLGILLGIIVGEALVLFFHKCHIRDSVKVLIVLSVSFLMLELQNRLEGIVAISGLLAIMSMGIIIKQNYDILAQRLSLKYNKLWLGAEVFLFVLVGAAVDVRYALSAGSAVILLVAMALIFRMLGVFLSLLGTSLTKKERLFCMLAYTPKATVQAAIGTIPLAMGLACGNIVLTVAVVSILLTAPFGAICVDKSYKKLLKR